MLRRIFLSVISLFFVLFLFACHYNLNLPYHIIYMLTNYGSVSDGAFNENIWKGITDFGKARDIKHYYIDELINTDDPLDSVNYAVLQGATIIVAPGYQYNHLVYQAQSAYPDIYFILVDSEPVDEQGNVVYGALTSSLLFAEEESGFLVGFMATVSNHEYLGFMGGAKTEAVQRFGIGYIYGAFYAYAYKEALNLSHLNYNLPQFSANHYAYIDSFVQDQAHENLARDWYEDIDVIFAAAGGANFSIFDAAITANKNVIGVDVDQGNYHEVVLTSALKKLDVAINQSLTAIFRQNFVSGKVLKTIKQSAVGLPTGEHFRFQDSSLKNVYANIENRLRMDLINIPKNVDQLKDALDAFNLDIEFESLVSKV